MNALFWYITGVPRKNCEGSTKVGSAAARQGKEYVFSYNNVKVILSMNDIYYLSKEDKLVCFHTRRACSANAPAWTIWPIVLRNMALNASMLHFWSTCIMYSGWKAIRWSWISKTGCRWPARESNVSWASWSEKQCNAEFAKWWLDFPYVCTLLSF